MEIYLIIIIFGCQDFILFLRVCTPLPFWVTFSCLLFKQVWVWFLMKLHQGYLNGLIWGEMLGSRLEILGGVVIPRLELHIFFQMSEIIDFFSLLKLMCKCHDIKYVNISDRWLKFFFLFLYISWSQCFLQRATD